MRKSTRLPSRFPVGTKYVLESRGGQVHRYVEYPDGRRLELSAREPANCNCLALQELSIVPDLAAAPTPRRKPARTTARRRSRVLERA
ncbi:MAG TPA: hypothetical protein VGJ01_03795 [Pseudolabrys sp.]|jgi:hypothetical protein